MKVKISDKVIAAYSTRQDGNMSLCYGDTSKALSERKKFLADLGIDYSKLVGAQQTHSKNVAYVTEADLGKGALLYDSAIADTDAFITDKPGIPLAVFTADCLSVFLYDPVKNAIAMVHAGWRGTQKGIASAALDCMRNRFKTNPADLIAYFGPCIRSCCFEVEADFKKYFPNKVIERDKRLFLDIPAVNAEQLTHAGVKPGDISDCGFCTVSQNDRFFSFRKEADKAGRLISVIMLR
ncbi:MAG: peptidoglycan editing factor PgeF [Candidatus Omnitrophica bacterium]|nr:peptidoglycan editing factor PgeF [Candidatus Omnitrophota bacterium]